MICRTSSEWIGPWLDGELDAVSRQELENHLKTCVNCSEAFDQALNLRQKIRGDAPYFAAPDLLAGRIRAALQVEAAQYLPPPKRWTLPSWWKPAAVIAAVLLLGIFFRDRFLYRATDELANDAVSAHVRALMPGHLIDVPSSDQHTVKPWFNGRIDFSPRIVEISGFELKGGRLDYIGGQTVAVLIFQRRQHVIDLFISSQIPLTDQRQLAIKGYNILQWKSPDGLFYSAVSDLNAVELEMIKLAYLASSR